MKTNFSIGWPEIAGLTFFGGTLGAVLCGAGSDAPDLRVIAGILAGAATLPALCLIPWQRPQGEKDQET